MMWGNWLFWLLVGGLVLLMFSRGGCCGHASHGGSRDDGGQHGGGSPGTREDAGKTTRKPAGVGCH